MLGLVEIRRRKLQFALIGLVVTLITYLVLMVNGLGIGLKELAGRALLSWDADAIAYAGTSNLSVIRSELSNAAVSSARQIPGVTDASPLGYYGVDVRRSDGAAMSVKSAALLGFDLGSIGQPQVISGRNLEPGDAQAVLADRSFLKAAGLHVGDSVTLAYGLSSNRFHIVGEIDEGAFLFQPTIYALRTTWQQMKYGGNGPDEPAASIVLLKGEHLAGQAAPGLQVVSKSSAFNNIEGVSAQQQTVNALAFFGYLIGALVIGVFFYVLTVQKVPQIGVLKAIGASSTFVATEIVVQVLALALGGVIVAVPLAWLTSKGLQQLPQQVPLAFTTGAFVVTSVAMVVTALIGALLSAWQAVRVDPIIALGQQQ